MLFNIQCIKCIIPKHKFHLHHTHVYDIMRGVIAIVGCLILNLVNMSRVYHYIRMQNTIKLYVLTAMMEVFDNLLVAFGIDVFDSLLWKTRGPSFRKRTILLSLLVTIVYVIIHSGLYFLHIATLTVAINTGDQSLLTILILNNFAEMKSFVLKKFDYKNLFQLACSDISERFKMSLFYFLIITVGVSQSAVIGEVTGMYVGVAAAMLSCEVVVDWIKHAFITKFNAIDASCYDDFRYAICRDFLNCHKDKFIYDHSYTVTRRLGLSQIPLGVVFVRYITLALTSSKVSSFLSQRSTVEVVLGACAIFAALVAIKIALGVSLIYGALVSFKNRTQSEHVLRFNSAEDSGGDEDSTKRKARAGGGAKRSWSPRQPDPSLLDGGSRGHSDNVSPENLSTIERYTMLRGRIIG